jgi:hypothetical protein
MGTATPMPLWDSLAARHLPGPIAEPGEHRGDPMPPYTLLHPLIFPHWPAMRTASDLCAHAGKPNLALTDKSRLSVLSLCVRL